MFDFIISYFDSIFFYFQLRMVGEYEGLLMKFSNQRLQDFGIDSYFSSDYVLDIGYGNQRYYWVVYDVNE